ncbi:MAG: glycosyltransferase [Candidatus Omnitrophota bacterium]
MKNLYYRISPFLLKKRLPLYRYENSKFIRLNIGCLGKRTVGYCNIDAKRTRRRVLVFPFSKLPFSDRSIKSITFNPHALCDVDESVSAIIREWERILVPGGTLTIETNEVHSPHIRIVSEVLQASLFVSVTHDDISSAYYRRKYILNVQKGNDYYKHRENALLQKHDMCTRNTIFSGLKFPLKNKTLIMGVEGVNDHVLASVTTPIDVLEPSEKLIAESKIHVGKKNSVHYHNASFEKSPFDVQSFESILLFFTPETFYPEHMKEIYSEMKRILADNGTVCFFLRYERDIFEDHYVQFFDKARFVSMIDEIGGLTIIKLETVVLKDTERYLMAYVEKRSCRAPFYNEKKRKICALGEYGMLRYNHLGFHWDGQARAFDELGLEHRLIDIMRNKDRNRIIEQINHFKPDYLLIGLREGLPLIQDIYNDIKHLKATILYWYCDPSLPQSRDLGGIIDFMFLSNAGQIVDYREKYGIKNIFYLPQGYSPYVMFRHQMPEIHEIGFSGTVSPVALHKTRIMCMNLLRRRYNVTCQNTTRNTIAEFYSSCKLIFGSSDFPYELYTSNRFFIVMGCGGVYLCHKFPGIEKLVKNKEHVLWFESPEEMLDLAHYYINHQHERNRIRESAEKLAREQHTYTQRIRNMLEIVEGKAPGFSGFLN